MDNKQEVLNHFLVVLFNQILSIEEKALKKGPYKVLTLSELHVIEAIGEESPLPMSTVASRLDVTVGTLTIAINSLVKKGYVNRERSIDDKRVVLISLTSLGVEANHHHARFHEEMIAHTVNILEEGEMDILIKTLSKITTYFERKYDK